MATATIRIDQPTHTTQPSGVAGRARDDLEISEAVTLRSATNSGVTAWRWSLLAKPTGSSAVLTNPVTSVCQFTPDLVGSYMIRLEVNDGLEGETVKTLAVVRDADGLRIPASGETTEANWLIDGVPNSRGWHPDLEAYLAFVRAAVGAAETDIGDLDTRVTTLEGTSGDHETRISDLETSVSATAPAIIYDLDFTAEATNTLADGAEVIDGLTWTAANIASRTTLAEITNGVGLRMTHVNGSTSTIAGGDTAPRIYIELEDIIPSYDPTARYFFFVAYSWAVTPDAAGERMSLGVLGPATSPNPSAGLRFAGATASYNAAAVNHEGERSNTISNSQTVGAAVLGFSLDGPTGLTVWQAAAMPDASLAGVVPVIYQQAANATAGGQYELFHYATGRLTIALAATGSAAIHSVIITGLRIIRG